MSKSIAAVVSKMVGDLEPLKSDDERERAFAAVRAVLGMAAEGNIASAGKREPSETSIGSGGAGSSSHEGGAMVGVQPAGAVWIKRNGLSKDIIEEYFHIEDGKVTLIGEAIGKGKREQTINTYLLTGAAALLETGKPDFSDKSAREQCVNLGCYDSANHGKTLGQFGNQITGSKSGGWKLTAPGLGAAATLLKPKTQDNK